MNKGLLVLHVQQCDDAAPPPSLDVAAAAAACAGLEDGAEAACAASELERLRVVEVRVARWNPNKGRLEAQVMGV